MGIMKVKGQTFIGKHKKLISTKIFHTVQDVLNGKKTIAKTKHRHLYQKMMKCHCGRILIGERQKGRIYYRCQNKACAETTIREDRVDAVIEKLNKHFT
jgi:uncharacterized protein YlzI (FlbEa/FlbD family)